ncbi:LuxR family transcriptional regulator [Arthrobacter alpinus]|uniref:HD domain-containing phosphohydrolase n=1 Tax=Arthrobacter alpinus TaxID=656366 RepID=UPI0005C8F162|nr:HD domain-containing phosphohydrolase [Arthrobacter alpinus]ALV44926.1 LuxR family transcriptional regulator [Arthrobacter alpinus]
MSGPTRPELLAALSLAIDLGLGQPMDHMLRATLLGMRIADLLDIGLASRERLYYANLLAWIGCHADSFELAALFGDDISFRSDYYQIDTHGLPMLSMVLHHTGTGMPRLRRTAQQTLFTATANTVMRELISSHCTSAGQLASRVGLETGIPEVLRHTFERWDGLGLPEGKAGFEIPLEMRIAQVADMAEVFIRTGGVDAALATMRARRGTQFDPGLVDLFCAHAADLTAGLFTADPWPAAIAAAPEAAELSGEELNRVLGAMGDFADLKSPWTAGHSRSLEALAAAAARERGLKPADVELLRRASWVHDLGRMGVSNGIWDKRQPLATLERERLEMYPYLTERILGRIPGLRRVAAIAGAHHERLDGSGYPRGLAGGDLDVCQRMLAAACSFQTSLEPRPHRKALTPQAAGRRLNAEVAAGRIDGDAAEAVLVAAGHREGRRRTSPSPLTEREMEVLTLICRGMNNKQIGEELLIAPKTARNHIEHIYLKIGATNRVAATLYALDNGLWSRADTA